MAKTNNKIIKIEYNINTINKNDIATIQNIIFKQFQQANEMITAEIKKYISQSNYDIDINIIAGYDESTNNKSNSIIEEKL